MFLDRLQRWIDTPMKELRQELCMNTNGTKKDAMDETLGLTKGELIRRWVEEVEYHNLNGEGD